MNWLMAVLWFVGGVAAASLAARERVRRVGDLEFVRGWSAAQKARDEQDPEVRNV